MGTVRWALVAVMAAVAGAAWTHWADSDRNSTRKALLYQCPMHPAVVQRGPGACPICGMDLVLSRASPREDVAPRAQGSSGRAQAPAPFEIASEPLQHMGMRTAQVSRRRIAAHVRTVGFVSTDESAVSSITARTTGWVESARVAQAGQRVRKGEILAAIESPEILTAQQVFLGALAAPGARTARAGAEPGGGVEAEARRRLRLLGVAAQDVATLARRRTPLEAMPIRAPIGGYVARRAVIPGAYVQPGTELFQIADLSSVWVLADVYERDMSRLAVGQRARLVLAALPGEEFTGRVQLLYPALKPESRTLQARIELENPGLRLRPGMFADVVIEAAVAEGLAVPAEAVVDTGERQYVYLAREGGRFEARTVRLGARGDGVVQVLGGVEEGDVVVTSASFLVDSESRLRPAAEASSPSVARTEGDPGEARRRRAARR